MLYEWKIKHICAVDRWPPWRLWTQQSHRLQWRTFSTSSWNGGTYFTFPPPCLSRLIRCNLKSDRCVVLRRVPTPVLMSKFSDTTKALMDVMSKQATSDTASALRWVSRFLSEPVCLFRVHFLNCSKDWFKFCICRSCHAWPLCWGSRTCLSGLTRPLFRRTTAFSASQCTASPRSVSPAHSDCLRIITC